MHPLAALCSRNRQPDMSLTPCTATEAPAQADWCVGDKSRFSKRGELRLYAQQVIHQKLLRFEQLLQWLAKCDPVRLETVGKARIGRLSHSSQRAAGRLTSRVSVALVGRWQVYARQIGRVYRREAKEYFDTLRQHHLAKPSSEEVDSNGTLPTAVTPRTICSRTYICVCPLCSSWGRPPAFQQQANPSANLLASTSGMIRPYRSGGLSSAAALTSRTTAEVLWCAVRARARCAPARAVFLTGATSECAWTMPCYSCSARGRRRRGNGCARRRRARPAASGRRRRCG